MGALKVGRGTEDGRRRRPADRRRRSATRSPSWSTTPSASGAHGARRRRARATARGYFYEPTVLADVPDDARLLNEEIFGPVAPVVGFDDRGGGDRRRQRHRVRPRRLRLHARPQARVPRLRGARDRHGRPQPGHRLQRRRRRSAASSSRASAARAASRASTSTSRPSTSRWRCERPARASSRDWYEHAVAAGVPEPEAMALATATADGAPSVRFVLLKRDRRARASRFYTNYESRKGRELAENPRAALAIAVAARCSARLRLEGAGRAAARRGVRRLLRQRARGSQLGAWASRAERGRSRTASGWTSACATPRRASRTPTSRGRRTGAASGCVPEAVEFWEGRAEPPARPAAVRARAGRRLALRAAVAVATSPARMPAPPASCSGARLLGQDQRAEDHRADRLDGQRHRRQRRRQPRQRDRDQHPAQHLRGEREQHEPAVRRASVGTRWSSPSAAPPARAARVATAVVSNSGPAGRRRS